MEPIYVIVRNVIMWVLRLSYRFTSWGTEKVPSNGPVIIAPNHISNFDPLCVAYLVDALMRRRPRFLGKASLWRKWYLRIILDGCRQIPVERGTGNRAPTRAAEAALGRGECVVVYPEATVTTNLDLTPMRGKTGVARLALATGAPVFPVGMWGAQWMLGKGRVWRFRGHRDVYFKVGDPMYFPDHEGRGNDGETLREVTDQVMAAVDSLVRELHNVHPDGGAVPPVKDDNAGLRGHLRRLTQR